MRETSRCASIALIQRHPPAFYGAQSRSVGGPRPPPRLFPISIFQILLTLPPTQSLRQQYSGALTLQQQEAYTKSLKTLRERKVELETDLQEAKRQRFDVEDQLAALQVQHDGVKVWRKEGGGVCCRSKKR